MVVGPHPKGDADPAALAEFWWQLAPRLRPLDRRLTIPEVMNEPVFADRAAGWAALQRDLLGAYARHCPARVYC